MKKKLIDRLFYELDNDKEIIKQNIMQVMDLITLYVSDDYGKLTLTIKYEKNIDFFNSFL